MTLSAPIHQNEQEEKAGLAKWIHMCWNTEGSTSDVNLLVDKAFQYFDENMKRLYPISTFSKNSINDEILRYTDQMLDENVNFIFDTECQFLNALWIFNSHSYQLGTFGWQHQFYDNFKKHLENEINVMGNFEQKEVSESSVFPLPTNGKFPNIYYSWSSSFIDASEEELRDRVFFRNLFSHIWDFKNQNYSTTTVTR